MNNLNTSSVLKWVTGGIEAFFAIPLLGWLIYTHTFPGLFLLLLGLHIVTLVLSIKDGKNKHGSILGIVTACLAWIPIIGWIMHMITALLLMVDAKRSERAIEM